LTVDIQNSLPQILIAVGQRRWNEHPASRLLKMFVCLAGTDFMVEESQMSGLKSGDDVNGIELESSKFARVPAGAVQGYLNRRSSISHSLSDGNQ
jgi:hypothetical protein